MKPSIRVKLLSEELNMNEIYEWPDQERFTNEHELIKYVLERNRREYLEEYIAGELYNEDTYRARFYDRFDLSVPEIGYLYSILRNYLNGWLKKYNKKKCELSKVFQKINLSIRVKNRINSRVQGVYESLDGIEEVDLVEKYLFESILVTLFELCSLTCYNATLNLKYISSDRKRIVTFKIPPYGINVNEKTDSFYFLAYERDSNIHYSQIGEKVYQNLENLDESEDSDDSFKEKNMKENAHSTPKEFACPKDLQFSLTKSTINSPKSVKQTSSSKLNEKEIKKKKGRENKDENYEASFSFSINISF